ARQHGLDWLQFRVRAQELQGALAEPPHALLAQLGIQKIRHAQAHAPGLVGVGRSDAAAGRADAAALGAALAELLQRAVIGQDDVRREGDEEPPVHVDPLLDQRVPLLAERVAVDDDAVSDVAEGVGTEDPGRDQVEHERAIPHHDGVAGVRSALVAGHDVGLLAQEIDDLALALVTPLGADHDTARHGYFPPNEKTASYD